MKNKIQRFLVTAGLAVFVIFFTVKCPSNTNFTTITQAASAKMTVTMGGQATVFGLDTTTIAGTTASSNISGNTMAAGATCQVTGVWIRGQLLSSAGATGVVGDQPIQVNMVTPEADRPKP